MERIKWIAAGRHRILLSDFTGLKPDEWVEAIQAEHDLIQRERVASVLLLSDFTGARFTSEVAKILDNKAHEHGDRIRASAVVGPTATMRLAMANTSRQAGRALKAVESRESGIRYLTGIADGPARNGSAA
jgi:hypothetical protein